MKRSHRSERIAVGLANRQTQLPLDEDRLRRAVEMVLEETAVPQARISLAVVDDRTIRRLNRRYLGHDCATDVLSFLLEQSEQALEGEVVVSAETAQNTAARFGWSAADELLLYVIHGTLHLIGHDDKTPRERGRMRALEKAYLARFGLRPQYEASEPERSDSATAAAARSSSASCRGTKPP
jgi:probable rRNA maturation factor